MHRVEHFANHLAVAPTAAGAGTGPSATLVGDVNGMVMASASKVKRGDDGAITSVPGVFQYYSGPVRSLTPDGTIYFETASDGNQIGMQAHGIEFEQREVTVGNARDLPDAFYERGFGLAQSPTALQRADFFEHEKVVSVHYKECEELLLKVMNASTVLPFDYIVRSVDGSRANLKVAGGQGVQGVAIGAHADYTIQGAPKRLVQLSEPPRTNDIRLRSLSTEEVNRAQNGRWCIVNVWWGLMLLITLDYYGAFTWPLLLSGVTFVMNLWKRRRSDCLIAHRSRMRTFAVWSSEWWTALGRITSLITAPGTNGKHHPSVLRWAPGVLRWAPFSKRVLSNHREP
jgi:hypothetical protein